MTPRPFDHRGFSRPCPGFSLVEVVLAVGIFAVAVVSVLGLIAAVNRGIGEVSESDEASRVATLMQSKLQEFARRQGGGNPFAPVRSYMGPLAGKPGRGTWIYVSRDGGKLGLGSDNAVWNPPPGGLSAVEIDAQKYFAVEILPDDTLSPAANDATAGFLAFTVRLIYPAYLGNGQPVTDATQQSVFIAPMAILR